MHTYQIKVRDEFEKKLTSCHSKVRWKTAPYPRFKLKQPYQHKNQYIFGRLQQFFQVPEN